jgi:hypothetical protein
MTPNKKSEPMMAPAMAPTLEDAPGQEAPLVYAFDEQLLKTLFVRHDPPFAPHQTGSGGRRHRQRRGAKMSARAESSHRACRLAACLPRVRLAVCLY